MSADVEAWLGPAWQGEARQGRAWRGMGIAIAILSVTLLTSPAKSGYLPSQVFLETCNAQDTERKIACAGYIAGVTDSYLNSNQFCIPARIDPKEITLFTKDYVLRTRSIQNTSPVQMILYALKARFPCVAPNVAFQFNFNGFNGRFR